MLQFGCNRRRSGNWLGLAFVAVATVLGACGEDATNSAGDFEIEITGDAVATFAPPDARMILSASPAQDGLPATHMFWFGRDDQSDQSGAVTIMIYGAAPLEAKDYDLTFDPMMTDGGALALFVQRRPIRNFGADTTGILHLQQTDDSWAGSFEFRAHGGAIGEIDKEIAVTGRFEGLTLTVVPGS